MPISSETLKRYALCILGLFFSAQGVAITKLGALGVSPISSVANVMSLRLPALSLRQLADYLELRAHSRSDFDFAPAKFQPIQLLQIPLSFLFGYFTDFGMWAFSWACPELYPLRLVNICCGTIMLGFGISFCVIANAVMNSGEAFVKAVSDTTRKDFGTLKICFDVSCVVIALVLSLLFFDFTIQGTREAH